MRGRSAPQRPSTTRTPTSSPAPWKDSEAIDLDKVIGSLPPDDWFLLCTDRLSKVLAEVAIVAGLAAVDESPAVRGAGDNVTAVAVRVR